MKFVADMGISPKTVSFLRAQGHDLFRLNERGMAKAKDAEVLELARNEGRVILTMDLDFSDAIALSKATAPSVISFRLHIPDPSHINQLLASFLPTIEPDLEKGAIATVEDTRIRIRQLPIF